MRVTANIGPGHHGGIFRDALRRRGVAYRATCQWPELTVEQWDGAGEPRARVRAWYQLQRRLTWALWRRLPAVGKWQTPRVLDCATFDLAARSELEASDVFIGWSQVSLRSIARARALGAVTLLEHPMTHVDCWRRLLDEEYWRWPTGGAERYSVVPRALAARMHAEYRAADFVSVLSSFARRSFVDAGMAEERIVQLPLGIDERRFSPGAIRSGPFRVLFVGRVELLKGVQYLLEAARTLDDVEVWLVGARLAEAEVVLQRLATPRVRLLGVATEAELPEIYRQADALVFPSINDAFGLTILEAMASGLPVIATEHSGGPDILDDGEDGFVVPARDAGALRERILWLAADRGRARRMGERARDKVLARYTVEKYADRLIDVLGRLTQRRGSSFRRGAPADTRSAWYRSDTSARPR